MGTVADKLQAVLNSKNAIRDALTEVTGEDAGNVMSTYADTIRNIEVVKYGYLSIVLNTTQETNDDIIGVEIIVSYSDIIYTYTWEGLPIQIKIPSGHKYTITVNDVDGYAPQEEITGIIESDVVDTKIITYHYVYITTITLDQTITDPATMITRVVDNQGVEMIRANSHRYNGTVVDGVMQLTQLPDDGSGTPSTVIGTDVWMKLPQFYYCVEEIATDKWNISFAYGGKLSDDWKEWDGKDLIGVYKAYADSSKLYSVSGATPTVYLTQENAKMYAIARGAGFSIVKWKHHCVMGMLFYALYLNTDCQSVCGFGTAPYPKITGATNGLGMIDTTTENGNLMSTNFWGLENWWGDIFETIDNVSVNITTWTITEDDGTTRIVTTPSTRGYITKINLNLYLDMIPKENKGTGTTAFCDYHYVGNSSNMMVCRAYISNQDPGGVADVYAHYGVSSAIEFVGSRLAYRGEYLIIE